MPLARIVMLALVAGLAMGPAGARGRTVVDADAPRALAADGRIAVSWTDPAGFRDIRLSGNRREAVRGDWVRTLAEHLREVADRQLPPGERLDVVMTDIDRAGEFEPWRSSTHQDIRYVRDLYPPRAWLRFTRLAADGSVLSEGKRTLSDPGYLMRGGTRDSDPLRHDKRLLERWVRQELGRGNG